MDHLDEDHIAFMRALEAEGTLVRILTPGALRRAERRRQRQQVCRLVWVLGAMPLPVVDYALLWRRYRPVHLGRFLALVVVYALIWIVRLMRLVVFMIAMGHYMREMVRLIGVSGSLVTFSHSYFHDILTYMLRNYPSLLERREQLHMSHGIDSTAVEWLDWLQYFVDTAARNINAQCVFHHDDGVLLLAACTLHRDLLVFRFSDVLAAQFPLLAQVPFGLTCATLAVYLLLGVGAQVLSLNVVGVGMLQFGHRIQLPGKFAMRLGKLWRAVSNVS